MAQRANNGQKARGKNGKPTDAVIVSPGVDSFSGVTYQSTADIVADARTIIESAHDAARRSVNTTLVLRNWYLGKRIAEEELKGADRAEYGKQVIERLSNELKTMGKGFGKQELHNICSVLSPVSHNCRLSESTIDTQAILDALSRASARYQRRCTCLVRARGIRTGMERPHARTEHWHQVL